MSRAALQHAPQNAGSGAPAAASLRIGPAHDAFEQEADQAAEKVITGEHRHVAWSLSRVGLGSVQRQCSCGGTCADCKGKKKEVLQRRATSSAAGAGHAPASVSSILRRPGSALDGGTRSFMESRFGYDFSRVRIHNDSEAADSARDVAANAYTVGSSIVFNHGKYQPHSPSGRKLLAHELAHVVQQGSKASFPEQLEIGSASDRLELEADAAADVLQPTNHDRDLGVAVKPMLQRQPQQTGQQPSPTPGFSVNQGEYLKMLREALGQMQGRLVESKTLAPTIKPMLDALVANVVWIDGQGKQHGGGGPVQQQFPGSPAVSVKLTLALDDATIASTKAGDFEPRGTQNGTIRIFIKKTQKADDLAEILFHEALHAMVWLANRPAPPELAQKNTPQSLALRRAHRPAEVQLVKNSLDNLASVINPRRRAKGQASITQAGLDKVAPFLVEEALVYAETTVFRTLRDRQSDISFGPLTQGVTGQQQHSVVVNQAMVDNYVFDFSGVFLPGDRALLTPDDQEIVAGLSQILENFYNRQVKERTAAPLPMSVPREQVNIPLPPLNP